MDKLGHDGDGNDKHSVGGDSDSSSGSSSGDAATATTAGRLWCRHPVQVTAALRKRQLPTMQSSLLTSTQVWQLARLVSAPTIDSGDGETRNAPAGDQLRVYSYVDEQVWRALCCGWLAVAHPPGPLLSAQEMDVPASSTHPFDPTHAAYLSDISDLNNLHQAPLLDLLARRFRRNDIYVRELKSKI